MCQWAAALGATVIGTVSTEEKAELARALAAQHPIVYSKQDFVAEVKKITGGENLPVVYDSVGRTTFIQSLDCLKVRGLMVSFGNASGPVDTFSRCCCRKKGSLLPHPPYLFHYITHPRGSWRTARGELFDMVSSGKVKVEVKQRLRASGMPPRLTASSKRAEPSGRRMP